jgi:hypothetical protein
MAFPTQDNATVSYNVRHSLHPAYLLRYTLTPLQSTTKAQVWTAVNFDVPDNSATICRVNFQINTDEFKNAPFSWTGIHPRAISVSRIQPRLSNGRTTWNNVPATIRPVATFMYSPEGSILTVVNEWFQCPKGQPAQFIIRPASETDMELSWFELDYPTEMGGAHGLTLEMHT